jgi:hypothetical protein
LFAGILNMVKVDHVAVLLVKCLGIFPEIWMSELVPFKMKSWFNSKKKKILKLGGILKKNQIHYPYKNRRREITCKFVRKNNTCQCPWNYYEKRNHRQCTSSIEDSVE